MKKTFSLLILGIFILGLCLQGVYAEASETLTVKANVLESTVSISIPDQIIFPDIAPGYLSERGDLVISNVGTVDISVTPELSTGYEGIFKNLAFRNILSDPLTNIAFYDFNIAKPTIAGGTRDKTVYIYLNLEDYSGTESGYKEVEVVFTAMEN